MAPIGKPPSDASDLRKQAEAVIRGGDAALPKPQAVEIEVTQALHELQVHQIELELQNEELRRAQVALDAMRARYFDLYDLAPVGYCMLNEHGLVLEANLTATTLLGVPRGAMVKQAISRFIHPDDKDLYYMHRKRLLNTEDPQAWDMRMLKGDGTAFWGHLTATVAQDTDGTDVVRLMLSDVTERIRVERAQAFLARADWLTSRESFFPALARFLADDLGMDYVCIDRLAGDCLSAKTLAIWFDGQFEDNVSYTLKDTPCGDVVGQTICCFPNGVRHLFPKDQVLQDMAAESYVGVTLWGVQGQPIGLIALIGRRPMSDTTLVKTTLEFVALRAAAELEYQQAEAEHRQFLERLSQSRNLEALGTLTAGVAHNFNNLLAAIMATASAREMLATERHDLEAYRIISVACVRGRDLVRSLIQFARPTLGVQSPIEIHALIKEVSTLLENTTKNHVQVVQALVPEPLWIEGDAGNLSNVLMNLCLNSVDAMGSGGTLTLRTTTPESGWVGVSVEDDGEGIAPAILARVLEPFFTTKPVGKGTGLGLSMSHGVIKAHGGTLNLSSQPGQGTVVNLRLPRIPAPVQEMTNPSPNPALAVIKVLLVDDDEDFRVLASMMLKAGGWHVESVNGGDTALEGLQSGPLPDLVILDQNMPVMDGIETMGKIRLLYPELLILISSGQPDIEEWACFKQPHVAVISKPFDMTELKAKLAEDLATAPKRLGN